MEKAIALIGSFLGLLAFLRSVLPTEMWSMLEALAARAFSSWAVVYNQIKIQDLVGCEPNELYCDAELYVSTLVRFKPGGKPSLPARRMLATRFKYAARATYMLDVGEAIVDSFRGVDFWWVYHSEERRENIYIRGDDASHEYDAKRDYTVSVRQRPHGHALLDEYLEYVQARAREARQELKVRLLYTNAGQGTKFKCIPLEHPSTFDSIAMDAELKKRLMADLKTFMGAREFYRRAGRAWKRGYLLHGPPGTGKSSLIAAMANFTGYDIYDLELTEVKSNAILRKLLMAISNKSIIVIEDIDCSVQMRSRDQGQPTDQPCSSDDDEDDDDDDDEVSPTLTIKKPGKNKMTLSGLLNFTDGLWSCCGNERIIVFTTNYINKIDPALLRTGRMDMHICMSYCTIDSIRVLARTYLGLDDEEDDQIAEVMAKIDRLIAQAGAQMTPADVAEVFTQHREVADPWNVLLLLSSELEKRLSNSVSGLAKQLENSDSHCGVH